MSDKNDSKEDKQPVIEIGERVIIYNCSLCDESPARVVKRKGDLYHVKLCDACLELISQPRVDKLLELHQKHEERLLKGLHEHGFITDPTYGGPDVRD